MEGMNVSTIVILLVILVAAVFAGRRMFAVFFGKEDCCGGGGPANPKAKKFKATQVADTDESHYDYELNLTVGGMTCEKCVENVQNAVNSLPDTWARVSLDTRTAHVLAKAPIDREAVESVIDKAGYYVIRQAKEAAANA